MTTAQAPQEAPQEQHTYMLKYGNALNVLLDVLGTDTVLATPLTAIQHGLLRAWAQVRADGGPFTLSKVLKQSSTSYGTQQAERAFEGIVTKLLKHHRLPTLTLAQLGSCRTLWDAQDAAGNNYVVVNEIVYKKDGWYVRALDVYKLEGTLCTLLDAPDPTMQVATIYRGVHSLERLVAGVAI